jgi:hypothetical protein
MKYFLTLIIFIPLFSHAQSNDQLLEGSWVKVNAQMKDGSRIVDHNGCGMSFLRYNFASDGFVNRSEDVLFDQFKMQYKLSGDSLLIGGNLFNLIGLTKDTLKLSYFFPGAEDSQIPVYYFAKTTAAEIPAKSTFSSALKDSVYQATNQLFPQCKDRFTGLMSAIAAKYDKGTLKASFIVDKKGRVKSFTILEADSISNGFAKIVGNAFGDLEWLPARKRNIPVNSIVQVTLKSGHSLYGNNNMVMNTLSIDYPFLTKITYGKEIDSEEAESERQLFKDALNQFNSGNYAKAAELFGKCIEMDSIDLNAYYLRALANINLGKQKDACKDWTTLAGMGQRNAAKNLSKYCK